MTQWEKFFREKATDIFTSAKEVIDIGGGLRIDPSKNNRFEPTRQWLVEYSKKVNYKIMDPVPDYNPDIIGDIHKMPFKDGEVDAFFCIAVLEHVEDPIRAMDEIRRCLKDGGKALIYVPFLYYYHAERGYYGDYWRFTVDTLEMFGKKFSQYETQAVRLPIETLVRLTPLGRYSFSAKVASYFDKLVYKSSNSKQVSGYWLYVVK
jgi:SAM-dependent methyltransferase